MAREVLGITGAIIGAEFGQPGIGFAIGSTIGAIIDGPTKVKMPGLGEAPIQTSRDGMPIPIVWGIHHLHGNVIQKNAIQTIIVKEKQGKGGGTVTESERNLLTFGIGMARSSVGPIEGVSRIWEFDKLIYDTSFVGITAAEHAKTAAGLRIYLGDESQLPDPDFEAETGVGFTPAYRGLSYVVFFNKDITDFGSVIPQYRFELNAGAELVVTSHIYPIEIIEAMSSSMTISDGQHIIWPIEAMHTSMTLQSGLLRTILNSTSMDDEALQTSMILQSGVLNSLLESTDMDPEALQSSMILQSGVLVDKLITNDMDPEALQISMTLESGSLVTP